ncbi:hypothetical protein GGR54DRAFT_144280 [Hypoxylon sp. NC1633]|nr:hypothetical protein GGR54DRAFT_144280 [Hypoxylon sp. NC1633]
MAIDSLRSLIDKIPYWLKRLEELNGQIEQRQQDLAMLPENQRHSSARSMRNQGSTESLKPRDDDPPIHSPDVARVSTPPPPTCVNTQQQGAVEAPSSPVSEPKSKTSLQRQTNEVMATAQRRARATLRKRQKTDSMISNENNVQKFRSSRTMIIVYYDSYVQSFFEEVVKFVSLQRNSMRKAKMAARVAYIKRLAEVEMPDEEEEDDDGSGEPKPRDNFAASKIEAAEPISRLDGPDEMRLRFLSTRQMGSRNLPVTRMNMRRSRSGLTGGLGSFQDKGDIWEELDKGLEFVQGMCEHGAHQFLRDGDCAEEVEKIKMRLEQTKEIADKELARVVAENPELAESPKSRSYRPVTMRRDTGASTPKTPPKTPPQPNVIEVEDEGIQDMDGFRPKVNGLTS